MSEYSKTQNKANLNQVILLLTAVVLGDNEEDIDLASRSVAYFDRGLAKKYWELGNALPEMFSKEMKRAVMLKSKEMKEKS